MAETLYQRVRVADPQSPWHTHAADLLIRADRIAAIGAAGSLAAPAGAEAIDCEGEWVSPGWVDTQVMLSEPGYEWRGGLASLTGSAHRGGFTDLLCLPHTAPPLDNAEALRALRWRAQSHQRQAVCHCYGALTRGLDGTHMAALAELEANGAVAFTDVPHMLADSALLSRLFQYLQLFEGLAVLMPLDPQMARLGVVNESPATLLQGLPPSPALAEMLAIDQLLQLLSYTGGRLHLAPVTTAAGVERIAAAKREGLDLTAGTAPHYLYFSDEALAGFDPTLKLWPPLRTREDTAALRRGLADGTLDCIGTLHAPLTSEEKDLDFMSAAYGALGLETAFAELQDTRGDAHPALPFGRLIEALTHRPRERFGLPPVTVAEGQPAQLTFFHREVRWTVTRDVLPEEAANSPLLGQHLTGRAVRTLVPRV